MAPKRKQKVSQEVFNESLVVNDAVQQQITKLSKRKAALEAKLNNFCTFLSKIKLTQPDESKIVEVELRVNNLESHLLRDFSELLLELENLDPENFDASETDEFESFYYSKISEAKHFLICHKQNLAQSQVAVGSGYAVQANKKPGAKLPTIELPKFSGAYEKWLEFRDLYISLVHNCEYINPVDKFHYLRSSLEGPAARCIGSIDFSAENYSLAWDILCARFENKSLMVHNYIKALFSIKNISESESENPSIFRSLVDTLTKNLRCLQSLGVHNDSWDPMIIYLVTSKLDSVTVKEWEQQQFKDVLPTLNELKLFLTNHADVLEKINMHKPKVDKRPKSLIVNTNSVNNDKSKFACYYCKKPHFIYKCYAFKALPLNEKRQKIVELKLCNNCLQPGHDVAKCKFGHCKHCSEKHHSQLHVFKNSESSGGASLESSVSEQQSGQIQGRTCCNYSSRGQVLLATALVHVHGPDGQLHPVRALLDNASMSNFITQNVVDRLALPSEMVDFSVVGIGQSQSKINTVCNINFCSRDEKFKAKLRCLVIPEITGNLPGTYFDPSLISMPSNLHLADPTFNKPTNVDMLIGVDTFWELMGKNTIRLGKNQPVVQETKLGWVISGSLPLSNDSTTSCHFSRNSEVQDQLRKFWEIEEVAYQPLLSQEESLAEKHFVETHRRDSSGRFIVSVPLKESSDVLGDSNQIAKNQFLNLERRFLSNPRLRQMYASFMKEYEELSHMSLYDPSDNEKTFFSPHHGVLREDSSTTKLRVVFNCSANSSSGKSYNSIQMVGPTVQDDLQSILLRFRQHTYVFTADICKMYRQVLVEDQYRPLQLIFWRSNPEDTLQVFSLNTVTYGTASAPFLATRCLKQLAIEHEASHFLASQVVRRDFYVDDLLSGAETIDEAVQLCKEVSSVLESGCFSLRKWKSNDQKVLDGIKVSSPSTDMFYFGTSESSKTLGTVWCCTNDTLSFQIDLPPSIRKITKRVILSETAKVFDILGLVSPVIVTAKILLQSLWSLKLSWDQEVPDDLGRKWLQFRSELTEINTIKIPRHVSCQDAVSIQVHGFSDASQSAYGACVYVRTVDANQSVQVRLLSSKTRVSPLKSISIPRLELCAAQLLAELVEKIQTSLTVKFHQCFLWSDSTVVLAWIRASPHNLQVFVGNRVANIQRLTDVSDWRYVPTNSNPADLCSRGTTAAVLKSSKLWFDGPSWLHKSPDHWPADISVQNPLSLSELPEVRRNTQTFVQTDIEFFPFSKFSSLTKIKRVAAYCIRFVHNCRVSKDARNLGNLTLEEVNRSMEVLVKIAQRESFSGEFRDLSKHETVSSKSKILSLTPFLDHDTFRVGGRLKQSSFSFGKKHPIVLSSKHRLTYLILKHEHVKLLHCGPQSLLAHVRETYWPIAGKNLAKRVVRECIVCFKFKPTTPQVIMGNLPEARVSPKPPFLYTGVDYAGPFLIKSKTGRGSRTQKCYLCLFVCLTIKAVHLELVTELSTSAFLETFQRFIARRGKPSHVYSDNGRNFVGASNELRELGSFLASNSKSLTEKLELNHGIKWHFITAYSPHQGGLWEAGVKSAKHHIKRVTSGLLLTFEHFYTVITQIESILNSRPLTPMSTDPNDLDVLTPAHFLIGRSLQSIPYPDVQDISTNRLTHFQQLEKIKQQFWTRWSREYLAQLQERIKWKTSKSKIDVGVMVLVREDNVPSYKWRLGRVVKVHPGDDNAVRVVSIKTTSGVIKRSVVKICPLPING